MEEALVSNILIPILRGAVGNHSSENLLAVIRLSEHEVAQSEINEKIKGYIKQIEEKELELSLRSGKSGKRELRGIIIGVQEGMRGGDVFYVDTNHTKQHENHPFLRHTKS